MTMDDTHPRDESAEGPRTEPDRGVPPAPGKKAGGRMIWWMVAVVLAFLAGFGWQAYRAHTIQGQLEQTEQELAVERLRVGLAQAAVAAQSGDFEGARQQMSDFFTAMQGRLGELPEDVRTVGEEMLRDRDPVITALSRADPRSADTLYAMLQRFRISLGDSPVPLVPGADTTGAAPAG